MIVAVPRTERKPGLDEARIDAIMADIREHFMFALIERRKPLQSACEAFGVIYEEFNIEFGAAMHANDLDRQRKELVQIGAMAVRALYDSEGW
jgi:hypothetical protein